jgi:tetratricopeptide (TPR) repeat protein
MNLLKVLCLILLFTSCNLSNDQYYNLACSEEEKGNFVKAIEYLNLAIEINPNDITALNNRGYDYMELKRFDLAGNDFQKMADIDSTCPGAFYGLGRLNYELEDYKKALFYFDIVIRLKGGGLLYLENVQNGNFKSIYSMDVPINKVLQYKILSEQAIQNNHDN